jgi:hypothetical protein
MWDMWDIGSGKLLAREVPPQAGADAAHKVSSSRRSRRSCGGGCGGCRCRNVAMDVIVGIGVRQDMILAGWMWGRHPGSGGVQLNRSEGDQVALPHIVPFLLREE